MKRIFNSMVGICLIIFSSSLMNGDKLSLLDEKFQIGIKEIEEKLDGVMGVAIKDLKTGKSFFLNEKEIFPQASSIKITILLEVFKQAEEGKLKLDEFIELKESQKVRGSGILINLGYPTLSLSIKDLCVLMIVLSDNTATNILIDRIGMDSVNRRMDSFGFKNTKLKRKMMDLETAREGMENISTPLEIMELLERIGRENAIKDPFRFELLKILSIFKESPLRSGIPEDVSIANKPGELEAVRCDSGIVYLKERPYIICVMTTYLRNGKEGEEAITSISRIAFEHFLRIQSYSEYGRLLPQH
ncbi:MAG: serine hydrolase [Acidobacteriota bacterium]